MPLRDVGATSDVSDGGDGNGVNRFGVDGGNAWMHFCAGGTNQLFKASLSDNDMPKQASSRRFRDRSGLLRCIQLEATANAHTPTPAKLKRARPPSRAFVPAE